jgi:hypothetical protein
MSYLEDFLANINYLPGEIVRSLELVRQLDNKSQYTVNEMESLSKSYLSSIKPTRDYMSDDLDLLDKIKARQYQAISLADEKIAISKQMCTLLERHINKLKEDLSTFKVELQAKTEDKIGTESFDMPFKRKKTDTSVVMEEFSYLDQPELNGFVMDYEEEIEDENLYCICNQPNYGRMIECEHPKCQKKWFHFTCVGLVTSPKGKWICPSCSSS